MSQTERIYWIDAQIRNRQYPNAEAVREKFDVSRRTAFADRDHLKERLHAPLVLDRIRGGWTYTDFGYMLPYLALSGREAQALRRSFLAAKEYLGSEDATALALVADRLAAFDPHPDAASHERVRGSIHLSQEISGELLQACEYAVEHRHKLHILYYIPDRDELTERVVQPYALLHWRGEPHLVAHCEWRQAMRQFFLGRIRQWEILEPDAAFARNPEFDLDVYLEQGFDIRHGEDLVIVRIRFSAYQARWVRERRYHESQEIEEQANGGLILTLRVAGTEEVKRWIISYGAEAEALEPASLRTEIQEAIKSMAKIYDV